MGLFKGEKNTNTGNERETRIEDQTQPYLLKPTRGKENFIEPPMKQPPSNQKQIKRMKKQLGKLNKKLRDSNRKHNNLVSKRSSIKKKIEELKGPSEPVLGRWGQFFALRERFTYRRYKKLTTSCQF